MRLSGFQTFLRAAGFFLSAGILLLFPGNASAFQPEATVNVLMIGNSWLGGAASHLVTLTEGSGDIQAAQVIHGGYNLKNQWTDPEQMAQIKAELEKGIYDYALINDFASLVYDPEGGGFHESYVRLFDELFTSYGVQTVIMLPWTDQFTVNAQSALTANEYAIAAKIGALVAPVGAAFQTSEQLDPDIQLKKSPEDSHPSPKGAYLRELVIYATLLGKSPAGLAGQFGLTEEEEAFLKDVAWQTVLELNFGQQPQPTSPPTQAPPTAAPTQTQQPTATEIPASTATPEPGGNPAATLFPEDATGTAVSQFNFPSPTPSPNGESNESPGVTEAPVNQPPPAGEDQQPVPIFESPEIQQQVDLILQYRSVLIILIACISVITILVIIAGILYLKDK